MVNSTTKVVILSTCLVAMLTAAYLHNAIKSRPQLVSAETIEEYVRWRATYKAGLTVTPEEGDYRLKMFVNSKAYVQRQNEIYDRRVIDEDLPKPHGPMFELNQFADLSDEEFSSQYLGGSMSNEEEEVSPLSELYEMIPARNADSKPNLGITHSYNVYNQGGCGSCWAFASANLAERKWFTSKGNKIEFSQQQLIDCDKSSNGCNGGFISLGLTYINNNGVATASSYPYKGAVGWCLPYFKSLNLKGALNVKTFAFSLSGVASWIISNNYAGGRVYGRAIKFASSNDDIYSPSAIDCANRVNHAVVLIDASTSENYVTMLNSWGSTWGFNGVKKIKPCSSDNYAGAGAQFYTY